MVISYVYFTRILVDMIEASIPYYMLWLGPFCSEMASLLFFVSTGYQFQPSAFGVNANASSSGYIPVEMHDSDTGVRDSGRDGRGRQDRQVHRVSSSSSNSSSNNNSNNNKSDIDIELAPTTTNNNTNNNTNNTTNSNMDNSNPMSALELSV